jgi:DNA topoisomerase I
MKEKWQTLTHKGPVFPAAYEPNHTKVTIKGQPAQLDPLAEEMAYQWAAKLQTKYVNDPTFQKNFWKDFSVALQPAFGKAVESFNFPKDFDFNALYNFIQNKKEAKKTRSKAEREQEKKDKDARKAIYGLAQLNGKEVELGNYIIEPAGIFMGRGEHPLRGRWKPQIQPEDVTLNLSKGVPVPPAPAGHSWKRVVENKGALWTCMWIEKMSGAYKRVLFSASSVVGQDSDQKKFEKAIKLANNFDKVNAYIDKQLLARDKTTRELATVCRLIATMSIRVGDEKGADTADTVGASSLRVEHIKLTDTKVEFDFLGKDSVRYHNIVEFDIHTIRNLREFTEGKRAGDKLFSDGINSKGVKEFFNGVLPGLTAKQFRTATGSTLLAKELQSKPVDPKLSEAKKVEIFTEANLQVALKLNHQTAVSEAYDKSIDNMKDKLKSLQDELSTAKSIIGKEKEEAKKAMEDGLAYAAKKGNKKMAKRYKVIYAKKIERLDARIARVASRVETLKSRVAMKTKTRGVALGTSKLNYSDPRIPISWCKTNEVDLKRIYPVTAQKKFSWAMDAAPDFFMKYPKV